MYRIFLNNDTNKHELEELVKIFLKPSEFALYGPEDHETSSSFREDLIIEVPDFFDIPNGGKAKENSKKNQMKRFLYNELHKYTGLSPDWGIITGIRPGKMTGEIIAREGSIEKTREILRSGYYVSTEKAEMLLKLCEDQLQIVGKSPPHAVGLYVGIPFCPTRCLYCSFTSNQVGEEKIEEYLEALHTEITFVSEQMRQKNWYPETIYIGGGTPTTLNQEQLYRLLSHIRSSFDLRHLKEFTLEAGRPDTISVSKLNTIKENGIHRISINPQSMKPETLQLIGRSHTSEDIKMAFQLAKKAGIPIVNADVIAGLPEEDEKDFTNTLVEVIKLQPENITVHTLALKRASRLKEMDSDYHYKQGVKVKEMLEISRKLLAEAGYQPYYLYRQKQMMGNFENVGYAKPGTEGVYNIRIMEEKQTIIALGAGGITKVYYPLEDRLERVPNVSNYEHYIQRIQEMLKRKEEKLFNSSRNLQIIDL